MALLFLVNGLVVGSWLPRLPEIRDRLGLDLDTLGLTLALGGLGSLIGSSISGVLVSRFGSRRTAGVAALAVYLVLPLIAAVPTASLLALVLAFLGFLDSHADVGMNAVGVKVEESVGRSVMTRLHGLWSLGTLVGSGLSALAILIGVSLGTQLLVMSVLGVSASLAAIRLLPETPTRPREGRRQGGLAAGLMLAGGLAVFVEGAPFDWSALFLTDVTGSSEATAGTGAIVFTAGMLAGRLAGDHVVDRFGATRTLYAGIGVALLALFFVVGLQSVGSTLVGFAVWGAGISVALPVLYKLAGSHPAFGEGSGLAALTVGTRLGFMAAPALVGVAATAWSLPAALAVVVGLAGAASLLAVGLTITIRDPSEDSIPGGGTS
ncbi:MAG TPA: MFS transporter [Acidimicrobiia bacterium]|nr:MFS transporter [Acidimicrobiia bacterium]